MALKLQFKSCRSVVNFLKSFIRSQLDLYYSHYDPNTQQGQTNGYIWSDTLTFLMHFY